MTADSQQFGLYIGKPDATFDVVTCVSERRPFRIRRNACVLIPGGASRPTHFKFEYFPGAIACRGWREGER